MRTARLPAGKAGFESDPDLREKLRETRSKK